MESYKDKRSLIDVIYNEITLLESIYYEDNTEEQCRLSNIDLCNKFLKYSTENNNRL